MQIREKARTPMGTRRQRNLERTELHGLPVIELMHDIEAEVVDQVAHANRHDDRLICRDARQSAPVEMIEMRVRHQNKIDRGQMVNFETRLFEPLDHLQPLRPDRIDQHVGFVCLNQERGVANPGDADFALADLREMRLDVIAGALGEERGNQNRREKVAFVPVRARTQLDPGRALILSAVLRGLANDVSPAFFRKRNRHCCASI